MGGSIEEFLKMAAARRQQGAQQQPQQNRQPQKQPIIIEDEVEIVDAQTVEKRSHPNRFETKVDTSDVERHAAHFGKNISQKHDRVEQRIHEKFDHDLGKLNVPDDQTISDDAYEHKEDRQSQFMSEIIDMLSKPQTISQAIILNEVLKRPEFDDF